MEFKFILKRLIERNDISQTTLAKVLGFTPQAVSRWCNGDAEPDTEVLKKIANYFGVSTDYLLGNIPEKSVNEELDTLRQLLIKSGFMSAGEDLTQEQMEKLLKFVSANKEFLKGDK